MSEVFAAMVVPMVVILKRERLKNILCGIFYPINEYSHEGVYYFIYSLVKMMDVFKFMSDSV